MRQSTIADACTIIEELLIILDNAYWEAATIERKDALYSIISVLHDERDELSKLSIQDHDLPYEPITAGFRDIKTKLNHLRKVLDEFVMRSQTARELERLITKVIALTS